MSNGTSGLLFGDGRSAGARRYRDLCSAFAQDLGEPLTASADQLVRRLAAISVDLELMDATRAAGEAIDQLAYARMSGLQRRLLADREKLQAQVAKPAAPSLKDHLAARYGAPSEAA